MCDSNGKLKDILYDEWFSNKEGEHIGWVSSLDRLKKINRPTNLIFTSFLIHPGKRLDFRQGKSYYRDSLVEEFSNLISQKEEYIISININNSFRIDGRYDEHSSLMYKVLLRLHHLKQLSVDHFLYDIPNNVKKTLVSINICRLYNFNQKYTFDSSEFKLLESINITTDLGDSSDYKIYENRIVLDKIFTIRDDIRYLKICKFYDRHTHMLSDICTKYILNCKTLFSFKTFLNDDQKCGLKRHLTLNRIRHILKYNLPKVYLYTLLKLIYFDFPSYNPTLLP